MGIIEKKLAEFELNSEKFRIELNEGPIIHIHYGRTRINLTLEEFKEFTETVSNSKEELLDIKELPNHSDED